jgi:NADPH:quinone reductase-like Zn-dependent oxidoreductase
LIPLRAAVCTRYGPPEVVEVREVDTPTPKAKEILVRVVATTVASGDCRVRAWNVPGGFGIPGRLAMGIRGPRKRILGTELAGEVAAVGNDVTLFKKGDAVVAATGAGLGAHAEYVCVAEDAAVVRKPAKMTYEEAATLPFGGLSALFFLRDLGRVRPGQKVLIYGASGSVGTAAVQLARHFGAQVTGVCSTTNLALVRSLGAHKVIDYTKEDFARAGETYDVVFDTVGKTSFSRCKGLLTPKGRYLPAVAGLWQFVRTPLTSMMGGKRLLTGIAPGRKEGLVFLNGLVEAGQLRAVIDRRYPLDQIVEAHRYVEQGHKKGNVVIHVGPN